MKNKVTFLALHMGYGGIEKTICSQANMICDVVDTEIISLYKTVDVIPYDLDSRVKVIYLTDIKPNKEEFKNSLRKLHIIKIFKEGFKAIKILHLKKKLVKEYIEKSDSKVIISTRVEFNELLNKYHSRDTITICEEHSYHHNNSKYINRIKKSLKNIDYFMPSSMYLYNDYKKILKGTKTKVKYIPLTIDSLPSKLNKLDNKNIISVGRLSEEKGFCDLIEVMKLVCDKDPSIELTICGDGSQRERIEHLINKYGLNDNIKITGFLDYDELKKEYEKSSLYVMTSYEESFGLVLIEAMSYGIPCFAFDTALGACEIINESNGKLIKNRDFEEMALDIIDYFNNKKNYKTTYTVKKYYIENVSKEWKEFVKDIIM